MRKKYPNSANEHELEKSRTLTSVLEVDNKKLKKESEVRQLGGKMCVIYRLMREMHKPGNAGDKIVNVSNFTQTPDLIRRMCHKNSSGFCRLDVSMSMKKRQKCWIVQ